MRNIFLKLRPLILAVVWLMATAVYCRKEQIEDSMVETDSGRMVVGLVVDGETINCSWIGEKPGVYVRVIEGDTLEIEGSMHHSVYGPVVLRIPLNEIGDTPISDPEIEFRYVHKVIPVPPTVDKGPGKRTEYLYAVPEKAAISFRYWDFDEGIVSGNFSFSFDRHYSDGKIGKVNVESGNFDIKFLMEDQL